MTTNETKRLRYLLAHRDAGASSVMSPTAVRAEAIALIASLKSSNLRAMWRTSFGI